MWRGGDLSFLSWFNNITILNLPVRDFWFLIFFLDFFFFCFRFFTFFFKKFHHIYYIGADMVDGRYFHTSPYFLCFILFSKFISPAISIISFSYKKCHTKASFFIFYSLKRRAFFYPRDQNSSLALARDFSPIHNSVISDLSFCIDRYSFHTGIHDWILEKKKAWNKILMLCPSKNSSISDIDSFLSNLSEELSDWHDWNFVIVRHVFSPAQHQWLYCNVLCSLLKEKAILLDTPNVLVSRDILHGVDAAVSCLMHFSLWSVAAGTPILMMDYDKKVLPIFSDLWIENMVASSERDFFVKIKKLRRDHQTNLSQMALARTIASNTAFRTDYE